MDQPSRRVVDISGATFMRLLAAVVVVWLWLRIWRWVLLFVIAVFIAIALDPIVTWFEAHRLRRRYAAPLVVLVLAGIIVGFIYLAGTSLLEQMRFLGGRLDEAQQAVARRIPPALLKLLPRSGAGDSQLGTYVASFGRAVMTALLSVAVALIVTVYLLLDGRRTYEWIVAFAPRRHRPRVHKTATEARVAILAYIRGNVATSIFASIFTGIVLTLLHVPAALLLALLAGIFDFVPVLGFIVSATPAVLLGLTVSIWVGVVVAALYVFYHAVENYYIAPKVYGYELRLSSLAVIVAFALGAELGGVIGALIALPLAAMYPVVENLWLRDRLGHEPVQDHRRIEQTEEH
jgi:predicted PurR-regulated permease PerM